VPGYGRLLDGPRFFERRHNIHPRRLKRGSEPEHQAAFNTVQTSGGMHAATGYTSDQAFYPKVFASSSSLNTPGSGYSGLAYNSGTTFWVYNTTTSAWVACNLARGGGGSVAGSDTQVQYNHSSAFEADANFTWAYSSQLLTVVAASSSVPGIYCAERAVPQKRN